jgi:hypothetical protein
VAPACGCGSDSVSGGESKGRLGRVPEWERATGGERARAVVDWRLATTYGASSAILRMRL